jgi:hypothetical protein
VLSWREWTTSGACAHVVVVSGDQVLLRRSLDGGRPVLEAPGVEMRGGKTPGLAMPVAAWFLLSDNG